MERFCSTREELEAQVRTTLFHEVGHHFGLTEEEVRRATYPEGQADLAWWTAEAEGDRPRDPAAALLVLLLLVPVVGLYRAWKDQVWPPDEVLIASLLAGRSDRDPVRPDRTDRPSHPLPPRLFDPGWSGRGAVPGLAAPGTAKRPSIGR